MVISKLTKSLSVFVSAAILLMASTVTGAADKKLTAPIADWTGGAVTCKVLEVILEQEMGYEIKSVMMPSGAPVYEAMAVGDLDFGCESWPSYSPSRNRFMTRFGGDGTVSYLGATGIVGTSTYYVPRYFVDETAPDLKSWEQLNKYKSHFATIETGDKGRLIACPTPAWECSDQERLDLLGVDFVAVELGTETAAWAEAKAAYARKEPFLLYAWTPHWIHAALDLVALELPAHDMSKWPATGWAEDVTYNYGNPASMAANPEAAQLIENMDLSNNEQAKMILAIDVDGGDMDEVVMEWVAANEDIWRKWMP